MAAVRAAGGLLLWLGVALGGAAQALQPVPPLTGRVVDLTGTLAAPQQQALEAELEALERRKGSQLAILMVATTQPEAIEQFGIRVVEAWKLGRAEVDGKRVDDGALLLVAKDDRKVRIEVGYGLEGAIPDAYARRIIAETIAPRFRQG
ncbi:MAG: YgcG family protein, partial [Burkholderiales bacterium]